MRFISEKALCFGLPPHHSQLPMPRSRTSAFGRRTKKSRAQSTAAALAPTLSDAATTAATWPDAVSSERAAEIAPAPHPTTSRPLAAKGGRATEPPAVASPDADASPAPAAAASRSKCASPEAPTSPEALTSDLKTRLLERKHAEKELNAADGTPYLVHKVALAEARSPTISAGAKQSQPMAEKLAEVMAKAGIEAMRDPKRAIAELLTEEDGSHAMGDEAARAEVHKATKGANVTNDPVERLFAKYDHVAHRFRYATVENLAGMSLQMNHGDFDMPPNVACKPGNENKPLKEHKGGFFYTGLNERLQVRMIEARELATYYILLTTYYLLPTLTTYYLLLTAGPRRCG